MIQALQWMGTPGRDADIDAAQAFEHRRLRPEDLLELVRSRDLELIVSTGGLSGRHRAKIAA